MSPEEMAAWVIGRLDLLWPIHRDLHYRHNSACPWCVIMRTPPMPDTRSEEEILLASAGSLS